MHMTGLCEAGTERSNGLARGCQGRGLGQVRAEHPYFLYMLSLVSWHCVLSQLSATFMTCAAGNETVQQGAPVEGLSNTIPAIRDALFFSGLLPVYYFSARESSNPAK